jgi:hypothetical protein
VEILGGEAALAVLGLQHVQSPRLGLEQEKAAGGRERKFGPNRWRRGKQGDELELLKQGRGLPTNPDGSPPVDAMFRPAGRGGGGERGAGRR